MHRPVRRWTPIVVLAALAAASVFASPAQGQAANPERSYELVSPPDKNGGEILDWPGTTTAADDESGAVVYRGTSGFADASGSAVFGVVDYLARRGAGGWSSRSLTPTTLPEVPQILIGNALLQTSPDLSRMVWQTWYQPAFGGFSKGMNIYRQETADKSFAPVTDPGVPTRSPGFGAFASTQLDSASDASHVLFFTDYNFTPETNGWGYKLYDWSGGVPKLASVLPDGTPTEVAHPPGWITSPTGQTTDSWDMMSADGNRILFGAPADPATQRLYLRRDGIETIEVSRSERSTPDTPQPASPNGASADGRRILFQTAEQLLDEDTDSGTDLYLYTDSPDPDSDSNLRLVSAGSQFGDDVAFRGGLHVADGRDRVYFVAGQGNEVIYDWNDGELTQVASVAGDDQNWSGGLPKEARVTADGDRLLFSSARPQPGGYDNDGRRQLYLYDASSGDVDCASCNPSGEPPVGDAVVTPLNSGMAATRRYSSRPLSEDGRYVFFSSPDALVADDVNGRYDAYQYDSATGELSLISGGRSSANSMFMDASPAGTDVLFTTRQRLVGWDEDEAMDLYSARAGGGFPEPEPKVPSCVGDECQDGSPAAPGRTGNGSERGAGTGNVSDSPRAKLTLPKLGRRALAAFARTGRLSLPVRVSAPVRVTAVLRSRRGGRLVTVGRAGKQAPRAGRVTLRLRLAPAVRRQLRTSGRATVQLTVSAGGRQAAVRQLRLHLPSTTTALAR